MIRSDRVGHVLQQHGLASARRRNDQAALAFAEGCEQVHDAGAGVLTGGLELQALLRIQRRQVVEQDLVAGLVRRFEVDGFDLDQREIFFAFVWRTYLAADSIAGFEIEFADLGGRDVNVVGARKVVVIGRAEEAVAVGQDFEDAFGEDVAFFFALGLEDLEDQVLLAHTAGTGEIQGPCNLGQLGDVLFFQFSNGHDSPKPVHLYVGSLVSTGDFFERRGLRKDANYQAGRRGWVKQPAVVPQQNSLVPTKFLAAPRLRYGPTRRSLFPGFWCWADGTSAWPWRQADTAYTGSAGSVKHQTHDQSA